MSIVNSRSYLFVPASRPERIAKAIGSGADAVIVDFEDAVAPVDKEQAREGLVAPWAKLCVHAAAANVAMLVRINGADTAYYEDDLAWCSSEGVSDVVLPKADAAGVNALVAALPGVRCFPLVENAAGFAGLRELANAGNVVRLLFGSIDLMFDLDIQDECEALNYFRSRLVFHSRAAGLLAPVDGVCTAIGDDAALAAETRRARAFGFGAKLLIHPGQVRGVHDGLAPSVAERRWAERVTAAAAAANGAAVAMEGKMVDRPVLERARRILSRTS
ncbi:HpcH/HpaI aldolase/citrate lyase family protein [Cupriavidus sp. H39]|uniref:HpcH/HpaI aldolase/citrate lyase family protein n=1 Tax=Cupriavidus sp. H39 TaxID=3401635 RepID=UPI003D01FD0F